MAGRGKRGQLQQRHSRALFAALAGLVLAEVLDPQAATEHITRIIAGIPG